MKNTSIYTGIGLLLISTFILGSYFEVLPDFVQGFCAMLGLVLVVFSAFYEKKQRTKIKAPKK